VGTPEKSAKVFQLRHPGSERLFGESIMQSNIIPVFSAIWFGILTSISPCPLATNIAATSYIGAQIKSSYGTLIAGLFYTIGRAIAYVGISIIILFGLLAIPDISLFLQEYMSKIIGPLLIVSGLVILKILPIGPSPK
jgi:cytochrome c biogenesis protein CcdA